MDVRVAVALKGCVGVGCCEEMVVREVVALRR